MRPQRCQTCWQSCISSLACEELHGQLAVAATCVRWPLCLLSLPMPAVLQETLRLDMDDESASELMQQLINDSATALFPQLMETTHRWVQYWR